MDLALWTSFCTRYWCKLEHHHQVHHSFVADHATMERDHLVDDQRSCKSRCALCDRVRLSRTCVQLQPITGSVAQLWCRRQLEFDRAHDFESRIGASHLSVKHLVIIVVLTLDTWNGIRGAWTIFNHCHYLSTSGCCHSSVLSNNHFELQYERGTRKYEPVLVQPHVLQTCSKYACKSCIGINDFILESYSGAQPHSFNIELRIGATERLSISIACIRLMVLDLVRIASDHELESRLACIDHLNHVYATDRIELIDAIRRYSGSVEQRSCSTECDVHIELHCSSINDIDAIGIIDDLVWISIIVIDQDDLDLEQWCRITERLSISIACIRLMVLDLVRIASDHELEPRLACIDHLDHVHATDRIELIDAIRRYSGSVEQRSKPIERELHIELHCSSINDIDAIGIIDDLVWISIIVIDQDDLDLEQWCSATERLSISIVCIRLMVLDLVRIASDHEPSSNRIIDHLDHVYATDRIELIDAIRRYSGSVEQRSKPIERELHIELHCSSINEIDAIGTIDDLVWISIIVIDQDDLDLEQWCRITERLSIGIVCIRLMVLDLVRIASDHELEPRLACIDHLDHVHATDRIEPIDAIRRYSGSVEQ